MDHVLLQEIGILCVAEVVGLLLSVVIARKLFPNTHNLFYSADAIFGLPYFGAVAYFSSVGTWELWQNAALRWSGVTEASKTVGLLITSRMIVHIPFVPLKGFSRFENRMLWMHHILCILVCGGGLVTGRCHFWGCLGTMCEYTNVFASIDEFFDSLGPNQPKLSPRKPLLFKINHLMLCVSFIIFRILLFPILLFLWIRDVRIFPDKVLQHPNSSWLEVYLFPCMPVVIWALSLGWCLPILRETYRTLTTSTAKQALA